MTSSYPGTNEVLHTNYTRFHWPSIVGGTFLTLSILILSVILARACDVDVTFANARYAGAETGAIIWGGIAALIAFSIGGFLAGRNSCTTAHASGWLNGLMVWALAVPLLVYFFGTGVGPRLGQSSTAPTANVTRNEAITASAKIAPEQTQPVTTGSPTHISHAQAAAWWMLASLGLGLVGSLGMGALAERGSKHATTSHV